MGGSATPNAQPESKVLQAYARYLPSILQATAGQSVNTAQQSAAATQATEPELQQLNAELTREFAPQLAATNTEVQGQQALGGSQTLASEIAGPGGTAAQNAASLLASANPAYAATENAAAGAAQKLIGSYDLSGLTPGEEAAAERSTNQSNTATGNLGLSNPTNTITNAMNFGNAYNAKRSALQSAIGQGTQTASTAAGAFNPIGIATGQPGTTGITQFGQTGTGGTGASGALNFGSGLLGNMTQGNNALIGAQSQQAVANSVPAYMGAIPSYS